MVILIIIEDRLENFSECTGSKSSGRRKEATSGALVNERGSTVPVLSSNARFSSPVRNTMEVYCCDLDCWCDDSHVATTYWRVTRLCQLPDLITNPRFNRINRYQLQGFYYLSKTSTKCHQGFGLRQTGAHGNHDRRYWTPARYEFNRKASSLCMRV